MEQITQLVVAKVGGIRTLAFQALLDIALQSTGAIDKDDPVQRRGWFDAIDSALELVSGGLQDAIKNDGLSLTDELSQQCDRVRDVLIEFREQLSVTLEGVSSDTGETIVRIAKLRSFCGESLTVEVTELLRRLFMFRGTLTEEGLREDRETLLAALTQIESANKKIGMVAVNATIEASRTGESGAGFRVIAEAIKELSGQTNKLVADLTSKFRSANSA